MKKNFISLFVILTIMLSTHCAVLAQWVQVNCPLNPQAITVRDGYLFAGSDGGIARTSNSGVTWQFVNNGLSGDINPVTVRALFSIGNYLLAGAENMDGLYLSTNNGNSWMRHQDHGVEEINSFAIHDPYVYTTSSNTVVSRSSDSGNSWVMIDSGLTLNPFGLGTTSVTANSDFVFCGNDAGQIYRSTNGDRWSLVFQDPLYKNVYTIASNGPVIFAQFQDSILRSLDNGDHWKVITRGGFGANVFFINNNIVFAGGLGVIYSSNNGDTWKAASEGLPDSVVIDAFTIKDGYLYTGAYETLPFSAGGLWRRPLSDFTNFVEPLNNNSSLSLEANHPNPFSHITTFNYTVAEYGLVRLYLYDELGREMARIVDGAKLQGTYSVDFDGSNLPNGSYIVRLENGGGVVSRKVVVER